MLNLEKSAQVVLNLTKDFDIEGQLADVIFVADFSQSMEKLYNNGTVQTIVERLVPVSMVFSPTKELEMWLFDFNAYKVPGLITEHNLSGFVDRAIRGRSMGGTHYAPVINAIANTASDQYVDTFVPREKTISKPSKSFWGKLFGTTTEETIQYNEIVKVKKEETYGPAERPTLVIFITDGENSDPSEAIAAITKASKRPIFFQFVGIKSDPTCNFRFLNKLDTMGGRYIDNANFFEITIEELVGRKGTQPISDEELYQRILNEFGNEYVPLAKSQKYRLFA